jgi:predicted permease
MIMEIIWDMAPFLMLLAIVVGGFAVGFYILFLRHAEKQENAASSLVGTFMMLIGDFGPIEGIFDGHTANKTVAYIVFVIFVLTTTIILLNLLIAIMGKFKVALTCYRCTHLDLLSMYTTHSFVLIFCTR